MESRWYNDGHMHCQRTVWGIQFSFISARSNIYISLFHLYLWPTTLTYNPRLAKSRSLLMPKIKVKGQTVQTGERPQTNGRTHTHTWTLPNVLSPLLRCQCPSVRLSATEVHFSHSACRGRGEGSYRAMLATAGPSCLFIELKHQGQNSGTKLLDLTITNSCFTVVRICWVFLLLQDDCRNYIRVLILHKNRIFTCGTNAFAPHCYWRNVRVFLHIITAITSEIILQNC